MAATAKVLLLLAGLLPLALSQNTNETQAKEFLSWYDVEASKLCNGANVAEWNYNTDINSATEAASVEASLAFGAFQKQAWLNVTQFDWTNFQDEAVKRQLKVLSVIGTPALEDQQLEAFENIVATMSGIYSTTKICAYHDPTNCDLSLDPELTDIMATSRDYNELLYVWNEWHVGVGRPVKPYYVPYVTLGNEGAVANGLQDYGDLWRHPYEIDTLKADVAALWEQMKPFYQQLHAYVRKKLVVQYGSDKVSRTGPIPAHLLGNMWAQDWTNILDFTEPFPNATTVDVTGELVRQNYTALRMFQSSEEFFTSLGLEGMPASFWQLSMLEKPTDGREVVCHASAWDFCDRQDYRIKMCTKINHEDFITIHHEMGHIEYFIQYKAQPLPFRDGANPGFHEAIGDTIALSVSTPAHLHTIGLLESLSQTPEDDLNFLFRMALEKVSFLPFGYVIDLWRWDVFAGVFPQDQWNEQWWKMRLNLQGIEPSIPRAEVDFDAAAKFHVSNDSPYLSYFVAFVIQFQFQKALCLTAGQYVPGDPDKPLYKCDIYQNVTAGQQLGSAMQLGYSEPWPDVLELITGERDMDAGALLEYFAPLATFLENENAATGEVIGWD